MDERVEQLVDLLECSIEEAKQLIEDDKKVDRMTVKEAESDLTPEQKAYAKKHRQGDRKPTVYQFNAPKEKKKNLTKIGIIAELFKFITENLAENAEITNESKIIEFEYGGKRYKLDLVERRKPKN